MPPEPPPSGPRLLSPGVCCALVAAVLYCTKPLFAKLAYPYGVSSSGLLSLRMSTALPIFLLGAWLYARRQGPLSLRLHVGSAGMAFFGYYLASWLDFRAMQHISVALERLIVFSYPCIVLLLATLIGRDRPSTVQWLLALFGYTGIACAYAGDLSIGGTGTGMGILNAFTAALAWAFFVTFGKQLVLQVGGMRFMCVSSVYAALFFLTHSLIMEEYASLGRQPLPVYLLAAALGVVGTVIPGLLTGLALERLTPTTFSLLGFVGPMSAILLAWPVLGEQPTLLQGLGILITLVSITLVSQCRRPVSPPRDPPAAADPPRPKASGRLESAPG